MGLVTILLISCSSDDDSFPPYDLTKDNLVGTYKMYHLRRDTTQTISVKDRDFEFHSSIKAEEGDFQGVNYKFQDNDTVTIKGDFLASKREEFHGEVSEEDDVIISLDTQKLPYDINQNKETLRIGDNTYEIIEFNERNLKLNREAKLSNEDGPFRVEEDVYFHK